MTSASRPSTAAGRIVDVMVALGVTAISAVTGLVSWHTRLLIDAKPTGRVPVPREYWSTGAVRAQSIFDQSLVATIFHHWLARAVVREYRRRPGLTPFRVLLLDHGPGGLAAALASETSSDTVICAGDSVAGMGLLGRARAASLAGTRTAESIRWVQLRDHDLPFGRSFDLVLSVWGMHSWDEPDHTLNAARAVLVPGGRVVTIDFRRDLPTWAWVIGVGLSRMLGPKAMRALDEPAASIRGAFRSPEVEWFAARAKLENIEITDWFGWIVLRATAA